MKQLIVVYFLLFMSPFVWANNSNVDSLYNAAKNAKHDTVKIRLLAEWGEASWNLNLDFWDSLATEAEKLGVHKTHALAVNNVGYIHNEHGDATLALEYYLKSLSIYQKANYKKGIAMQYNNIGLAQKNLGNFDLSNEYYSKSLEIKRAIGDEKGVAISLTNIGGNYADIGDIETALEYYGQSLEIREKLEDYWGLGFVYLDLAIIYFDQDDNESAVKYFYKSIEMRKKVNDKRGIAYCYGNLGQLYERSERLDSAEFYYNLALNTRIEIDDQRGIAQSYLLQGSLFNKKGDNVSAIDKYLQALTIFEELKYPRGITRVLFALAESYFAIDKIEEAKKSALRGLQISQELGLPQETKNNYSILKRIYVKEQNYKGALDAYENYILLSDSIKNETTQKATIRQQTKYEFEKAQLVREQEQRDAERQIQEQTNRRNNLQYSLIFLGILLFFGVVLSLGFIKVSPTVAEGLIFFAFLILFEFLLVLGDPFVESITDGEPIYKLLANAVLAGAIFPAHAFFERTLKSRLINSKTS